MDPHPKRNLRLASSERWVREYEADERQMIRRRSASRPGAGDAFSQDTPAACSRPKKRNRACTSDERARLTIGSASCENVAGTGRGCVSGTSRLAPRALADTRRQCGTYTSRRPGDLGRIDSGVAAASGQIRKPPRLSRLAGMRCQFVYYRSARGRCGRMSRMPGAQEE